MSEAPTSRPLVADSDTVPKLLLRNAERFQNRPAFRLKDLGIWQTQTWSQVRDQIRDFAIGLHSIGLERGDTVAIVGDNLPRLYWTFTAAQSLGAVPVPIYQDSVADEMAYVLDHAEIKIAVVENQEQVDKLLSISEEVPSLRHIVYSDPRGLKKYDHAHLHSYEDIQKLGAEQRRANAPPIRARSASRPSASTCTARCTSASSKPLPRRRRSWRWAIRYTTPRRWALCAQWA